MSGLVTNCKLDNLNCTTFILNSNIVLKIFSVSADLNSFGTLLIILILSYRKLSLLQRVEYYGIRGVPHKWHESYLSDRSQTVQIENCFSKFQELKFGVPQGSILSSLLFLIYVNDIDSSLHHGRIVQYADDTTLCFSAKSKIELEMQTHEEVNKCIQNFNEINLKTNPSKSTFIHFSLRANNASNSPNVMVDDVLLEETDSTKFLGIHLDRGLTWYFHVENVCKKVSSGIHALRKLSKFCPTQVLLMAYFGLIYPHLSYGIAVWGGCSSTNFIRIFRLQKKAIRIILKLNCRESCRNAFRLLGVLTLPSLYVLETSVYCISQGTLVQGRDVHGYHTRGRDNYRTASHRTVAHERLPSQAGVAFVNHLPSSLKRESKNHVFKTKLKRLLLSQTFYSVEEFLAHRWEER